MGFDAIVLTGGGARRMDGAAKCTLQVGGRSLLARVVAALGRADQVIVVGPGADDVDVDVRLREDPPGGGPVAALAAGVTAVLSPTVAVVAGDLPFLSTDAIAALVGTAVDLSITVAVDDAGRDQFLLAGWPTSLLRTALDAAGPPGGLALRTIYRDVPTRRVQLPGAPPPWWDCDTPAQLAQARMWADAEPAEPDDAAEPAEPERQTSP